MIDVVVCGSVFDTTEDDLIADALKHCYKAIGWPSVTIEKSKESHMNIVETSGKVSKTEAAELLGIQSYDTALPQPWLDEISEQLSSVTHHDKSEIYDTLLSSLVWSYDNNSIFGSPHPLTVKAHELLKENDKLFHTTYCSGDLNVLNV